MKNYLLIPIICCLFLTNQTHAQIIKNVSLTKEEQYCNDNQQIGRFFGTSAWVLDETIKSTADAGKNIRIYFPEDFYFEEPNGNKYAKGSLENNTRRAIKVSRIDATIDFVRPYFLINGKWIPGQENQKSDCGNSYFTAHLKAKSKIEFLLSISDLVYGNITVPFKISIAIDGQKIESNVIEVNLYENQIKRLLSLP